MSAVKDVSELHTAIGREKVIEFVQKNIHPVEIVPADQPEKDGLPPIVSGIDFMAYAIPEPPQLIKGLLHQGSKMMIGGSSKAKKTFIQMDLMLSVSSGTPWLGFETQQSRVLYINLELADFEFQERVIAIQVEKALSRDVAKNYDVWNLRGHAADISTLSPKMIDAAGQNYGLIIVDPIYKVLGNRVENDAGAITSLCNEIERIAVKTGA